MTEEELLNEYGWEKWGDYFLNERLNETLFIDIMSKRFGVDIGERKIVLKYDITTNDIRKIIKLFGEN